MARSSGPPTRSTRTRSPGSSAPTAATRACRYCSKVCCMVAAKQTIITKEHDPSTECTVFYNNMTSYGKGFEEFYQKASSLGVRYVIGRPFDVIEDPETNDLTLRYEDDRERHHRQRALRPGGALERPGAQRPQRPAGQGAQDGARRQRVLPGDRPDRSRRWRRPCRASTCAAGPPGPSISPSRWCSRRRPA